MFQINIAVLKKCRLYIKHQTEHELLLNNTNGTSSYAEPEYIHKHIFSL